MDLKILEQFDSAEISDALDACKIDGALLGIKPINNKKIIGPAFTVKYVPYNEIQTEFKNAANYIDDVPKDAVLVIDNAGRVDCTTWGDILTQVALIKKLAGTVVHGAIRDLAFIHDSNYPVFASAVYMRSGKNRVFKVNQQCKLEINRVHVRPNDIVFGDENGVLVIPHERLQEVIVKATNIKATEKKIINAVKSGMPLAAARKQFHYDQPWLTHHECINTI